MRVLIYRWRHNPARRSRHFLFLAPLWVSAAALLIPGSLSAENLIAKARREGVNTHFLLPLDGSVFPADFPPPTFYWEKFLFDDYAQSASSSAFWLLEVSEGTHLLHTERIERRLNWAVPEELWREWTGKKLTVLLRGGLEGSKDRAHPLHIEISTHSLPDDLLLRYFTLGKTKDELENTNMDAHLLWVDPVRRERKDILTAEGPQRCVGCHSASPSADRIHLLYTKQTRNILEVRPESDGRPAQIRPAPHISQILLPRYSPVRDKIVCSAFSNSFGLFYNVGMYGEEYTRPFLRRLLNPELDVAIYDFKTNTLRRLPGASEPDYVELHASWSPDGREIVFVRYKDLGKMDIYVVPYNDGKGGKARPLKGASRNGQDNYFPEFSPDKRWILFTRGDARYGWFALDSSDLYIVPASGGKARPLASNAPGVMDSWHNWSSDGRWVLYSSKRFGITTRPLITYIDENGNAAAPVQLFTGLGHDARVNMPAWVKKGLLRGTALTDGEIDAALERAPALPAAETAP